VWLVPHKNAIYWPVEAIFGGFILEIAADFCYNNATVNGVNFYILPTFGETVANYRVRVCGGFFL